MAGAIDLFSGNAPIAGANLFLVDKNPLQQLDQGLQDVIGKQAQSSAQQILNGLQSLINSILGLGLDFLTGNWVGALGDLTQITTYFGNLLSFLGDLNPLDPSFTANIVTAAENFIQQILKPTNLVALLVSDTHNSAGVSGFIPLENLAMDVIAGIIGGAQQLIDAILAVFGFPAGSGTTTDINRLFTQIYGFLGNPAGMATGAFNLLAAVENFVTAMLKPTNLVATLVSDATTSGGVTGYIPIENLAMSVISGILGSAQQVIDTFVNTFLGLPGTGYTITDLIRAIESIPAPLLAGTLLPTQISHLNIGAPSAVLSEFLLNPNFDTANSLIGQGVWIWDNTQGPGSLLTSVYTDATGALKELYSNPIAVAASQVLTIVGNTQWSGFTGAANSIALTVAKYDVSHTLIGYDTIGSVASPGTSGTWTALSATYTVPSGVATIAVRPIVTAAATAGRVWFGALSAKPTRTTLFDPLVPILDASKIGSGQFAQSMVVNLVNTVAHLSPTTGLLDAVGSVTGLPGYLTNMSTAGLMAAAGIPNITAGTGAGQSADLQTTIDGLYQGISGLTTTGNPASILKTAIQAIPHANVNSPLALPGDIGNALQAHVDAGIQGVTGLASSGNSQTTFQQVLSQAINYLGFNYSNSASPPANSLGARMAAVEAKAGIGTTYSPVLTSYTTHGSYTYTKPIWANHFDVIVLGGGGGGQNSGAVSNSAGGFAGVWAATTWAASSVSGASTFTVVVGAGGAAPAGGYNVSGGPGGTSSIAATGVSTVSAAGGAAGTTISTGLPGHSPGNYGPFGANPAPYAGGAAQPSPQQPGNAPGGGGSGGQVGMYISGGPGADGAVFIYAYQ